MIFIILKINIFGIYYSLLMMFSTINTFPYWSSIANIRSRIGQAKKAFNKLPQLLDSNIDLEVRMKVLINTRSVRKVSGLPLCVFVYKAIF